MDWPRIYIPIASFLETVPLSPSMLTSSDSDSSTVALEHLNMIEYKAAANQESPLLNLPDDIFKCVIDYLDQDAAWSLKRLCKGMANSVTVNQLLYRSPIQLDDVRDIRLGDWKYKNVGLLQWEKFQSSINDATRHYVHKLALSHWASIDDFQWIEANLPSLTSLDISAIKDFVWTPEQTWSWRMLADACPKLFAQIEELQVANWADYATHSRIEYSYSYNDYRFKQKFRISRRRDGGSVAKMIFPLCTNLKTLDIRDCYSGFRTWNEWEVHQIVCCLVDGIQNNCPASLTKLRVHDYAPYRSLFLAEATTWPNLTDVEINLYGWLEDRRDRDMIGPIPYRITHGHHHRDEEEAFNDKTFFKCERDHMVLGNHIVENVGASSEDLLQSLPIIAKKHPNINIRPIRNLENITLHPFHLVNVIRRRHPFGQTAQHNATAAIDPSSKPEVQEALRWLAQNCEWKPILAWDSLMCDVFPANLEPNRTFLPKPDVLARIKSMVSTLRGLDLPIRISIGDRSNASPSFGLDGSLYFGDFKTFVGEGEAQQEAFLPTQASFNLMPIASMIDELNIQYPLDVPGVAGWRARKTPTPAETALMRREMVGWRRFWFRYASQFKNIKKLTVNVPADIYEDWGEGELAGLLADERWDMLEIEEHDADNSFFDSYFPFSSASLQLSRKRFPYRSQYRRKFVQRVFFRLDNKPLDLVVPCAELSGEDGDDVIITDEQIKDREMPPHRFWEKKVDIEEKREKRKRCNSSESKASKKQKIEEAEAEDLVQEAALDHLDRALDRLGEF